MNVSWWRGSCDKPYQEYTVTNDADNSVPQKFGSKVEIVKYENKPEKPKGIADGYRDVVRN